VSAPRAYRPGAGGRVATYKPAGSRAARDPQHAQMLLDRVRDEMARQDERYPWPRTFPLRQRSAMIEAKLLQAEQIARQDFAEGCPSWVAILAEEVGGAAGERDPVALVEELVQVAAVALSWAQALEESE
jgi:hypothetical protein